MSKGSQLLNQCRKPTGLLGRFLLWTMNLRHSRVTDWGLKHISIGRHDTILDVGCGGGRTVGKLAAMAPQGKVYGIDHAEQSVAAARRANARLEATGRVEIRQGSVSQMPFADDMFDLVTAVETHFWWPDLPNDMREVFRILKPGGRLVIIAEVYKRDQEDKRLQKLVELTDMVLLTAAEHRELFVSAGFADVQIIERHEKNWICGIGTKPG
jgi:ubiquinone/menaquinone biosynthesis C-methylase UbiE